MNMFLMVLTILVLIAVPLMIVSFHDVSVTGAKTDQIISSIRANETCAELKGDMAFTDKENEGLWFKSPYDPLILKNMKEKNCS